MFGIVLYYSSPITAVKDYFDFFFLTWDIYFWCECGFSNRANVMLLLWPFSRKLMDWPQLAVNKQKNCIQICHKNRLLH